MEGGLATIIFAVSLCPETPHTHIYIYIYLFLHLVASKFCDCERKKPQPQSQCTQLRTVAAHTHTQYTKHKNIGPWREVQKGLEVCYCLWRCHPDPSPGSDPGPEVGATPARPVPSLVPSVPSRIGSGRAEADFLATSKRFLERVALVSVGRASR